MSDTSTTGGALSSQTAQVTFEPWVCCARPAGSITDPAQLPSDAPDWMPATVPGTAASALRANGLWDYERPVNLEASDWWYRTAFAALNTTGQACFLCFDGLATLAEVWLNGEQVLTTDNMFQTFRVDITDRVRPTNDLALVFRSLAEDLKTKRVRPRWKTNLVSNQQMRWQRTSLLGHIPGWSPPVPVIGPWRAVRVECAPVCVSDVSLQTTMNGANGVVTIDARLQSSIPLERAVLRVGSHDTAIKITNDAKETSLHGELTIANPPLWWPHTHGPQSLLDWELRVDAGDETHTVRSGKLGFRELLVDTKRGFDIHINGVPIYCRGACWTVSDIFNPNSNSASPKHDLQLARDAGMNMIRIGGTMIYESDEFYRLCDELGILVWQDFMFANMDYPVEDPAFAKSIETEARQQLRRLASHPCVAVYCGNSEVEQQAAMLGMPRETWRNIWFTERLPALCAKLHPGTAYVPSTPSGGVLPFHTRTGVTHYYGIGAYLRSPLELRKADVRFTSECLGFSNVPEPESYNEFLSGALPVMHHPKWKQRVPRDTGAAWDFEDVRDFYLQHLYGLDPVQLRSFNPSRYLQLSRTASGEMMAQTFSEWRSSHSNNSGGLVWFFKDLWNGAGWGIVDAMGIPKPAYYYLRRVWQTQQILLTDEGLDGLHLHVVNETAEPLVGSVEIALFKESNIVVAHHEVDCDVAARSRKTMSVDEILESFHDVNYAYRFGPPSHDVVVATLYDAARRIVSDAYYFTRRCEPAMTRGVELQTEARKIGDGKYQVTLKSDCFLNAVRISAKGYLPDDNYFHLPPSREKLVTFSTLGNSDGTFKACLEAINLDDTRFIAVKKRTEPTAATQEPQLAGI